MKSDSVAAEILRYAAAVLSVAAAAALTRLLSGLGDSGISPQFFAAVLLSAWFGGLGPGLVATALSGLATGYLIMLPHANSAAMIRDDVLRVVVFSVVAVLASSLHAATRRAALEANRARAAAESASAAKSRFLAMVSHELRTPLGPIVMISEMLADDPKLPDRLREDMRSIRRHVGLEIRLIEDLLDLTRINTGKLNLLLERIDSRQPIKAAAQVFESDLKSRDLKLDMKLPDGPVFVAGDVIRLQQIFWNLIRNAIKFSADGGRIEIWMRRGEGSELRVQGAGKEEAASRAQCDTRVPPVPAASEVGEPRDAQSSSIQHARDARVTLDNQCALVGSALADAPVALSSGSSSAKADPTQGPTQSPRVFTQSSVLSPQSSSPLNPEPRTLNPPSLLISVTDTGIGIDPRRLSAIFEAFEQADRDTAAQFGGLGLGLAICKALVEAHGGTIRARSAGAGHGATFTVALPLAPEHRARSTSDSPRAERSVSTELPTGDSQDTVARDTEVGR